MAVRIPGVRSELLTICANCAAAWSRASGAYSPTARFVLVTMLVFRAFFYIPYVSALMTTILVVVLLPGVLRRRFIYFMLFSRRSLAAYSYMHLQRLFVVG